MTTISNIANTNATALKQAARLEAGSIAIKQLTKVVKPTLPMLVRGYADHPFAGVVLANLFSYAVNNFASDNEKAVVIADAMLEGAMVDAVKGFNINDMINEVTKGIDVKKLTDKIDD